MVQILTDVPLPPGAVERLLPLGAVALHTLPAHDKGWELPPAAPRDAEVLLCKLPPRDLDALNKLKLIQLTTVGYEHLRHLHLADRPLRVCNARGIFDTAIGEWNLAMMVNLARDQGGMFRNQQQARWERTDRFQQEIRGKTLGLWGYGGIGRETARLAKVFGMTIHVLTRGGVRPRRDMYAVAGTGDPEGVLPDRVFTLSAEQEFLRGLDFLVLALPHTRQSDGMIGVEQLRALPRTAFLLNPARGPIVQEAALLRALQEGWIAGAALDTHFSYPLPAEHPLWRFPTVLITPHISGADKSSAFPERIADLFVQNLERYLRGRPLLNALTAQEWHEA